MTNSDPRLDNQNNFAAEIMKKIEANHITTHSRMRFILHDLAFWSLWFLSALLGAFALSATIFVLQSSDWQLYLITHDSFLSFATDVMPYLWLVLFLVLCLLAHINLRHTPRGYRYSSVFLILLNLAVTVIVAVLLTAAGLGKFVDEQVGGRMPLYVPVAERQELEWFRPQEGLLIGKVTYIDSSSHIFVLQSPHNNQVNVDGHLLSEEEWEELLRAQAMRIRVIGVPKTASPFLACIILPVMPNGFMPMHFDDDERFSIESRSIECRGVRPYDRFDQFNHW